MDMVNFESAIHIAFMKKEWKMTEKIVSGEKTIESRWYKNRSIPWNSIKAGDAIYFKDSGQPVSLSAKVKRVLFFENLTPQKVRDILDQYGHNGLGIGNLDGFYSLVKEKKYCILIFFENIKRVKPFNINKSGYGNMAAWITVKDLRSIKIIE